MRRANFKPFLEVIGSAQRLRWEVPGWLGVIKCIGILGLPSVCVTVSWIECFLCDFHFRLLRKTKEFLGQLEYVIVAEIQGRIRQVSKSRGCENVVKLIAQLCALRRGYICILSSLSKTTQVDNRQ